MITGRQLALLIGAITILNWSAILFVHMRFLNGILRVLKERENKTK